MRNLVATAVLFGALTAATVARADVPKMGEPMPWPTVKKYWLGDPPNASDASGKVVVHWFCSTKVATCKDDLARLTEMRESNGKVYVIAYISDAKNKKAAAKLDPVRDDVGAGAVAWGKEVDRLGATVGLPSGGSIIQDVDGKVQLVAPSTDPEFLDKRDAKVKELVATIKEYKITASGPNQVKVGVKFDLKVNIQLAAWLTTTTKSPIELKITPPAGITCTATTLDDKGVKLDAKAIDATFSCTASKAGNYELSAALRFGYESATRAVGVGGDSARWKFAAK